MTFTRSGITANLSPTQEFHPSTANTISLIDTFQESTNLLPLASKAPAPGNQVAHLVFTMSSSASPGSSIAVTLDPSVTLLSDEGGNTSESPANSTLVLVDGAIYIPSQMGTVPIASMAQRAAETVPSSIKSEQSLRPARFLNNARLASSSTRFSPRTSNYTGTTNHDAAFAYDEAGDVLHDDTGRVFTYDALSMTTGATAPMTNGSGNRNFAYIYTAEDERIALVETLNSAATTATWTLRGLDNHLLRTWTNSSTSGWSWREDDIWRGAALLANESSTGVRHYGLDHLGSPAILTDALAHPIGAPLTFDAFGNGGATGAGMLEYTGQERDSFNVGSSPGPVTLPDYLHARSYDPARGRFLSVDPLTGNPAEPQTWNRYVYAHNNPLNVIDPDGRCGESANFIGPREPCPPPAPATTSLTGFVNWFRTFLGTQDPEAKQAMISDLQQQLKDTVRVKSPVPSAQDSVTPPVSIPIPMNALKTLQAIDDTGAAPNGYVGGKEFQNDGRSNGQVLPTTTPDGHAIQYREWDVNPKQPGVSRGGDRLVTGSDNSAYYTNNHYTSFQKIR